jgi:hypothetical protein
MAHNRIISCPKRSDPFSVRFEPTALHNAGLIYTLARMAAFGTAEREGLKMTTMTERERYRIADTEYFNAGFERIDQLILHPKRTLRSTYVRDLAQVYLLTWPAAQ